MSDCGLMVDVYSDVICPWCYVGKRRLERALTTIGKDTQVIWRPFQLNPTMPKNGMDRTAYLKAKFGGRDAYRRLEDHVSAAGQEERIFFAFDKIAVTPNTFRAHRLIWHARRHGKQDDAVETLFRCFFVEGWDIGKIHTLTEAAVQIGLDRGEAEKFFSGEEGVEEVKAEESAGRKLGIRGVPYFVLNQAYGISGAQPVDVFLSAFEKAGGHKDASAEDPTTGR